MCASSPSSPLQVSYSSPVTQAKVLRHAVLHRTGQVCFSKEMLPEGDIGFIASETMVQEAGFVCLPAAAAEAKDILNWRQPSSRRPPTPTLATSVTSVPSLTS